MGEAIMRTALVTGADRGLGYCIAKELLSGLPGRFEPAE